MAGVELREYQSRALDRLRERIREHLMEKKQAVLMLYAPTGAGKSLRKGTKVIMADGHLKAIEDVAVGDRLLGPDGGVRNVLALGRGQETMYEVRPTKGEPYYVNASHILSLRKTPGSDGMVLADGTRIPKDADVVNVNVEVLARSNATVRHGLKGWRADAVEFHRGHDPLPVDPYILGVWLGDGHNAGPTISKPHGQMVEAWRRWGESLGLHTYEYKKPGKCSAWRLAWPGEDRSQPNPARVALGSLGVLGNKHIPDAYKFATVEDRLRLIAGLLDSDGHLDKAGYDWISKCPRLAEDFAFVCRSVGLAAYVTACTKGIRSTGFTGAYYRVSVSGDCDRIPCLDKKAPARQQKKRHLVTGLTLTKLDVEDYYGVVLDGDHLFLLGDFTVTHNTECAIALMQASYEKQKRSAMILDRIVLCDQTSARLQKYSLDHGVMQAGHWRYRPYERIQVCSAQTLEKRGTFPGLNLLIVDEAHETRKATAEFIRNNPDVVTIGLSASPFTDGLGAIYDKRVVSVATTAELVEWGNLVPLQVFVGKEADMSGKKPKGGEWTTEDAADAGMKITGDVVSEWRSKCFEVFGGPRKTIVFCASVDHGAQLARQFAEAGFNFVQISYQDSDEFKKEAVKDFSRPDTEIHGLIACDILTKGFDVPDVMVGVSARPFKKSFSSHVQQMGRVMRPYPGKEFALWLDHAGNYLRFREDWDELYHEGVRELKDGREKPKGEPTAKEKEAATCPKCKALWAGKSRVCKHCGYERPFHNTIEEVSGTLERVDDSAATRQVKQQWYSELLTIAQDRGYSSGWVAHQYRHKFGVWPKGLKDEPAPAVSVEVARWEKSRRIAFAKGKAKATA